MVQKYIYFVAPSENKYFTPVVAKLGVKVVIKI